jgi:TetR/AcrR family transcriptional regulator, regulator of cefoperazone and chloramphenicol sensitivity
MPAPDPRPRGDATRAALVSAAIQVFGRDGFDAVSTRQLADAARVNQALIGYHFRNKEGLYLAAFEHIAGRINERLGPVVEATRAALGEVDARRGGKARRDGYFELLFRLTDAMAAMMAHDDTARWAQLIVREQQAPTAAFALLYDLFMGRLLTMLTEIVQRLRGTGDDERTRLLVAGILGQVLVWRVARAGVLRVMRWKRIGASELALIQDSIRRSVRAQILSQD